MVAMFDGLEWAEEDRIVTRDSKFWWLGMVGGVLAAIAVHSDQFPVLLGSPMVKEIVTLLSIILAVGSGKMATSPLPGEHDDLKVK